MANAVENRRTAELLRGRAEKIIDNRDRKGPRNYYWENPAIAAKFKIFPFLFLIDENTRKLPGQGIQTNPWTGTLIMPSWRQQQSKLSEGSEPFHVNPSGEGDICVRLSQYRTIEQAMRGVIHASQKYRPGGEIKANAEHFMELTEEVEERFARGLITADNVREVSYDTFAQLERVGFGERIRKSNKKAARNQVISAVGPDRLRRFNPERSSIMLAAAYIKGFHEFLSASKVVTKYDALFDALASQRMFERMITARVLFDAENVVTYDGDENGRWDESEFRRRISDLKRTVEEFCRVDTIRTAPYRVPALAFASSTFGFDENVIGFNEWPGEELLDLPPDYRELTQSPADFMRRAIGDAGYDGNFYTTITQGVGSIEDFLNIDGLTEEQIREFIQRRVSTSLAPLWHVYHLASDWTNSSVFVSPPGIRNEKLEETSV